MTHARSTSRLGLLARASLALAALLAAALPATEVGAAVAQPAPQPIPVAVNLPAGDDAWMTPPDGGTSIDFVADPLPAGFFNPGSLPFAGKINLRGIPLTTSPAGALGVTDTLVRRLGPTGKIAVGGSKTVAIEFMALRLQSISPFQVAYSGGGTELWVLNAGLSPGASQNIGTMTITRTSGDGGTYDATLLGLFHLTFTRVNPLPRVTRVLDCGAGDCEEMVFASNDEHWTMIGGPNNWQPSQLGIDPLPPGVQLDIDGNGTLDGVFTIGKSNFQVGVEWLTGGGGGGGGGEGECNGTEHVNGQSKIETHTSFLAGDGDADGKPNDCDDCTDVDENGQDDFGGCGCDNPPPDCDEEEEPEVEPADPVPAEPHQP